MGVFLDMGSIPKMATLQLMTVWSWGFKRGVAGAISDTKLLKMNVETREERLKIYGRGPIKVILRARN